jgi:hypothetical protein
MAGLKTLTVNGKAYKVAPIVPSSGVTLLAAGWVENEGSYSQVVELAGVTSHTKVDLQPTPDQDEIFRAKTLAFVAENDDGVVTVFSVGDRPRNDYTIQVTMTEVEGEGKIRGNTVGVPNPQADWKQTDPTKADYIKNKPTKAEDFGARPNTWLPTIAEIGAAPAGYGLGVSDAPFHLTIDSTAFDNFLNIGWYAIQTTFKISDKTFYFVMLRVTSYGSGCLMQEVIPVDTDYMMRRYCWHGVWTEWDWDCPPMTPGVEYRTTERWDGRPVYAKLVTYRPSETIGNTSGSVDILIPHGISPFNRLVRENSNVYYEIPLPVVSADGLVTTAISQVGETNIELRINKRTWDNAHLFAFRLYYTKT